MIFLHPLGYKITKYKALVLQYYAPIGISKQSPAILHRGNC
jgi:hypothetical protein